MLSINTEVNRHPVKAVVGTGVQVTIMSLSCAEACSINQLIDRRVSDIAKSFSITKILGRVHSVTIKIGNAVLLTSLTIVETKEVDLVLGLDFLKRFEARIDLRQNKLIFLENEVPFLPDSETLGINESQANLRQICKKCQQLFDLIAEYPAEEALSPHSPEKTSPFHNVQALVSSASHGCHLCNLILISLEPQEMEELLADFREHHEDQMVATVACYKPSPKPILRIEEAHYRPRFVNRHVLCDLTIEEILDSARSRQLFRPISSCTKSDYNHTLVLNWLHNCERDHLGCIQRRSGQEPQLPTRLLYVGASQPPGGVQLRESTSIPPGSTYTTLSYCWGGIVPVRLLSSTYKQYTESILVDLLPLTFRDGITFTRSLSIDYIWIDALCIIQDSPADWDREALLMKNVFAAAYVNIAANSSYNPNGGLFQTRNPLAVMPFKASLTWQATGWIQQRVALFPQSRGLGHLHNAPLTTRAWCTQERLLARRTVHFLEHKIMWECSSLLASESDPCGRLEEGGNGSQAGMVRGWAVPPCGLSPHTRVIECLNKWVTAVDLYTFGQLSFQKDKLIAVAGIAKLVQEMWPDNAVRYLAGLWNVQLEQWLLWSVFPAGKRSADKKAPSWSWASVNGHISITQFDEDPPGVVARVIEAETDPINDEFGPVTWGRIRIQGHMCSVTVTLKPGESTEYIIGSFQSVQLLLDEGIFPEVAASVMPVRYHFLLVTQQARLLGSPMTGLILRKTQARRGEFVRLGTWEISDWGNEPFLLAPPPGQEDDVDTSHIETEDYHRLLAAFRDMTLDWDEYESADWTRGFYTTTIV